MQNSRGSLNRLADNVIITVAVVYICLPILIFFWGWLRIPYAIIGSMALAGFMFFLLKELLCQSQGKITVLFTRKNIGFWVFTGVITLIWVYFSGIGGFSFQNSDFWARNAIFRDLSEKSWPVIFDLSQESEAVQKICGSEKVAFSYYFCWWLPVALISRIFGMASSVRSVFLYLWALVGVFEIMYLLCRKLKKTSLLVPIIMIGFSGLDILIWYYHNHAEFNGTNHIEMWANYFQYSSNTTQLYWVFNQSIPVWLVMALVLQLGSSKLIAALGSLAFAYSPWATFGIIPVALAASVKNKKSIREAVNVVNISVPIIMLIVFGAFYFAGGGSNSSIGTIFSAYSYEKKRVLEYYIAFIFLEFGVYFLIMSNTARKYEYYWVTLVELFLFPLIVVRDGNFIMRGSIPALFLTMYYVIRFLTEEDIGLVKTRKKILVAIFCIGAITPLCEISRSVSTTFKINDFLQESVYSFADIKTDNANLIATTKDQFFVYDYEGTLFFKYLAK